MMIDIQKMIHQLDLFARAGSNSYDDLREHARVIWLAAGRGIEIVRDPAGRIA